MGLDDVMTSRAKEVAQMTDRAGAGRSRRRGGQLVEMKARVTPAARSHAHAMAEPRGITMAEYVEELLLQDAERAAERLGLSLAEYVDALQHHSNIGAAGEQWPGWWARHTTGGQEELPLVAS